MNNILFYLLSLIFLSGCQPSPSKPFCRQDRAELDTSYMESGFGIFHPQHFRDSSIIMPAVTGYDTVYWYRGSGGWGEFDHLCAIYSQNGKWLTDLVLQTEPYSQKCEKTTIPINPEKLVQFKNLLDSLNTRCLPCRIDTIGIPRERLGFSTDAPHYDFAIKEGAEIWRMHWGARCYPCEESEIKEVQEMRTLAALMLSAAGYPRPKLLYILEKVVGGYEALYYLPDQHLVRTVKIVLGDSILLQKEDLSILKISKRNDPGIERVRAHVELLDGTMLILAPERPKK